MIETILIKQKHIWQNLLLINDKKKTPYSKLVLEANFIVIMKKVKVKVTQSCPSLCDIIDYTVHGIP